MDQQAWLQWVKICIFQPKKKTILNFRIPSLYYKPMDGEEYICSGPDNHGLHKCKGDILKINEYSSWKLKPFRFTCIQRRVCGMQSDSTGKRQIQRMC